MKTKKPCTLTLILLLAVSSMLWVETTAAQSIPKPSVPEATAKLVDYSYDIPPVMPTYTTDPYTGNQKQANWGSPGYHVKDIRVEFTIRNQPFTPYNDSAGHNIGLYYNFRFKGHYGTEWNYDPFGLDGESSQSYGGWDMTCLIPYTPSNSEYTKVSMTLGKSGIPDYGEADFQVQAQIGYILMEGNALMARVYGVRYNFTGQSSDWSSVQTINLSDEQNAVTPTASPTPDQQSRPVIEPTRSPEQTSTQPNNQVGAPSGLTWEEVALAVACGVIAVLAVALVLSRRKRT